MDNNLKSVPQRKLLRDDQKSSPAVYSQQIGGVWQSDRGMRREMKEKHPCESEWYAKALRHLLVQYKESVRLVICQFLNKLNNPPHHHHHHKRRRGSFLFSAQRDVLEPSNLERLGSWFRVGADGQEILACLIRRWLMTSLSVAWGGCRQVGAARHSLHTQGDDGEIKKPLPWGEMVSNHALSCCPGNACNLVLAFVCFVWARIYWIFIVSPKALLFIYKNNTILNLWRRQSTTAYDRWLNSHYTPSYPQIGFASRRCNIALEDSSWIGFAVIVGRARTGVGERVATEAEDGRWGRGNTAHVRGTKMLCGLVVCARVCIFISSRRWD